jgi:hypothetical protein
MKPCRVVDEDLLETVRNLPCMACADKDPHGAYEAVFENQVRSHPHHLITRGSGGHDLPWNVIPLCVKHHQEIHNVGIGVVAQRYKTVFDWLVGAEWIFLHPYIWLAPRPMSDFVIEIGLQNKTPTVTEEE